VNHLQQLERVIRNASQPGHFHRDQDANEHEVSAWVVRFSHQVFERPKLLDGVVIGGEKEYITRYQTAVVVAPNSMTAQMAATRPYKMVDIIACDKHHLSNPTVLRVSYDSYDEQTQAYKQQ